MQRGAAVAAQAPNNAQNEKARQRAALDQAAIQEALKAEAAALEKAKQYSERLISGLTEDGETRWELSIRGTNQQDEKPIPTFGEVGYGTLLGDDEAEEEEEEDEDSDDDSDESETEDKGIVKKKRKAGLGRISFGNFNKEVEVSPARDITNRKRRRRGNTYPFNSILYPPKIQIFSPSLPLTTALIL